MSQGPWRGTIDELEARIQARIVKLYRSVGFKVYNLSQGRRTNQTPGLSDLLIMHPVLKVEATHEVKAPTGKVSEPQQEFAQLREECGRRHLIGGMEAAEMWLIELGLLRIVNGQQVLVPKRGSALLNVGNVDGRA